MRMAKLLGPVRAFGGPITPQDIARRLNAAEQEAILWLPEDGSGQEWATAEKSDRPKVAALYALADMTWGDARFEPAVNVRLCALEASHAAGLWCLTPLGQAVREVLSQ